MKRYKQESKIKTLMRAAAFNVVDILSWLLNPRGPENPDIARPIKKIVIIDIGLLGDLLMTTPLIVGIKECLPNVHLTLVCTPWAVEAVNNNHAIDEIHLYDAFWEDRGMHGKFGLQHLKSTMRTIRFLRRQQYDVVFVVTAREQPFVPFLGYISGSKIRIGIGYPLGRRYLTHAIPVLEEHIINNKLRLLRAICCDSAPCTEMYYFIKKESIVNSRKLIAENYGVDNRQFICITPSTFQVEKRWRVDAWVELINRLTADRIGVIIGGGNADTAYNETIYRRLHNQTLCRQVTGKINLNEFAALMQLSMCLITVESGPMHLAAAVRVPCVVLFSGIYDFKKFKPLHAQSIILHKDLDCSGCQRGCSDPKCMSFRVEDVLTAVSTVIDHKRQSYLYE